MKNRKQRRKEQEELEVEYARLIHRRKSLEFALTQRIDDKEYQERMFKNLAETLTEIERVKKAHDKLHEDGIVNKAEAQNKVLKLKMIDRIKK